MLIPGEVLWTPVRPMRLPGVRHYNPAVATMQRMYRLTLWATTLWLLIQWVTESPV